MIIRNPVSVIVRNSNAINNNGNDDENKNPKANDDETAGILKKDAQGNKAHKKDGLKKPNKIHKKEALIKKLLYLFVLYKYH